MNLEKYTKLKGRLLSYGKVWFGNKLDEQELEILADAALSTADENKTNGKYIKTDAQFSTYIFTIFRHKCLNRIKSLKVREQHRTFLKRRYENGGNVTKDFSLQQEEYRNVLGAAMNELCSKCRQVLLLKYFENKSMDEIAVAMNFKNRDVAKSKRYECFNKLEKIVKNRYSKDELF